MALAYDDAIPTRCPRCNNALARETIRHGLNTCSYCQEDFAATLFDPPQRLAPPLIELAAVGPDGAGACANHARNAAVTSCIRCGLFICSLCEMKLTEGSFCPACFDRVREEGALRDTVTRYRDYGGLARMAAIAGLLLIFPFGIPIGAAVIYYAAKALRQARDRGESRIGAWVAMVFGIVEIAGGAAFIGLMVWS